MSLRTSQVSFHVPKKSNAAASITARQDRIPVWTLSYLLIGIIGSGFLFTFFDIGDINVSFVQTCTQIVPGCHVQTASHYIGLPVLSNLVGYMLGALLLSPLADRYGRRDLLVLTMVITGLGSLYTAFVGDYTNFIIARTITGIGVGADLALVSTYISEVAPNGGRAKYTALIFAMGTIGSSLGIWIGLYLTTPATAFPFGLPIALAGPHFQIGWRVMYGIGALLSICGLVLRFELPESPRWLVSRGRLSEAERIVTKMEHYALTRIPELPPISSELPVRTRGNSAGYSEIFGNPLYLKRTILFMVIWLVGYITVYSMAAGTTVLLTALGYTLAEAGIIAAFGTMGGILCALIAYTLGERLERKYWLAISALLILLGGTSVAFSGSSYIGLTLVGAIVMSVGADLWLPMTLAWSAENYPTRARATGFALVDGVGHVGGGIGLTFIASLAVALGPLGTFLLMGSFLVMAAFLAQFGPATRGKRLDEVSP
ncbi:MAG: MFS transporter [Chloroflexota bacterium]|nr:MFS transporter [Chloroflexota bacterium]